MSESILDQYDRNLHLYDAFTRKVEKLLTEILEANAITVHSVTYRNAMCNYPAATSASKASGDRPARWQSRTAMVWLRTLRNQRASRCQASRAQTFLAW